MNTINTPHPTFAVPAVRSLNSKAMLVKLTCYKPAMQRRDRSAEGFVQAQLNDTSLTVSSKLFKEKTNPVRVLTNKAGAVYDYHTKNTLPWVDRGPRLLPVEKYDDYSQHMRKIIADVESATAALMPHYDKYVSDDIIERGARASLADYPTKEDFEAKLKFKFFFSPLPDASHYLFDVSEDDKAALTQQLDQAVADAQQDMAARIHDPLVHLVKKLRIPIGRDGSVFRDSAVTNVTEALDIVAGLAMGDETVLSVVDEVRRAIRSAAAAPDVLRQSPDVRAEAAEKLAKVADRMAFMFGGS